MKRWEALEIFGRLRGADIVVYGPGGASSELHAKSPSELNIYSPMPYPTSFALGLALALPKQKIVVMQGDGSVLSGLTALPTLATVAPQNLVNIVWDNGTWFSSGTMGTKAHYGPVPAPTAFRTDLAAHARASGFDRVSVATTLEEFENVLRTALAEETPSYIVAKVEQTSMPGVSSKQVGTVEEAVNFRRALIERNWVGAAHAGVSHGKWLAPDERSSPVTIPDVKIATESGPRPSLEKARVIYTSLRRAGVDFIAYVPDSANYLIQRFAREDTEIIGVAAAREDDALAMAMGAFMGGRNPAVIMEASGLGLCPLAFAILSHEQRLGALILYSHNFALGEVRSSHACTRWIADPLFDALMIPHMTLTDIKDAPLLITQAWRTVRGQMCPVAISLPLAVIWDE
jgi:thiamine pyrophosphate-dependent acetolactate synthase large subunit-like protein